MVSASGALLICSYFRICAVAEKYFFLFLIAFFPLTFGPSIKLER